MLYRVVASEIVEANDKVDAFCPKKFATAKIVFFENFLVEGELDVSGLANL